MAKTHDASAGVVPPLLSARDALYLDFDGTLTDIAPHPDAVTIARQLPALIDALRTHLDGAVAIVTGRRLDDIDTWLAPLRLVGAGLHGAELRRTPTGDSVEHRSPEVPVVARSLLDRFGADSRLLVENKGASVALHFRSAPERARECTAAMRALATTHGLVTIAGKMVVEARAPGIDKGRAILALASAPPFQGRRPVFVGDDVTDEDGFAAVQASGGFGIKVGDCETRARYRCADVDAVHHWIEACVQHLNEPDRERA
ncbi:trehalose-phosphatase [Fontimonas sp. SYSU GA230001]|uniref:trehalose-phosphatase n=1 Tax=Fontimonas sp. SYSU GA230001 TaxID=3142450 RepID=UPI0032B57C09